METVSISTVSGLIFDLSWRVKRNRPTPITANIRLIARSFQKISEYATAVINQKYGNDPERRKKLRAEGISEEDVYVSINSVQPLELEGIGQAYPNPASDIVNIDFTKQLSANANYKLINTKGQVLLADETNGNGSLRIDVSKLKSGIYWLIFTSGNQTTARKIVIGR